MPVPNSAKKAHRKWDTANRSRYWQCNVRFPAADRDMIKARAESLDYTVAEYIRSLVDADLKESCS